MYVGESEQRTRGDPEKGSQCDIMEPVAPPIDTVPEYRSHDHLHISNVPVGSRETTHLNHGASTLEETCSRFRVSHPIHQTRLIRFINVIPTS